MDDDANSSSSRVVVDADKDVAGFNGLSAVSLTASATVTATGNVIAGGSFVIGSADMDETDLFKCKDNSLDANRRNRPGITGQFC